MDIRGTSGLCVVFQAGQTICPFLFHKVDNPTLEEGSNQVVFLIDYAFLVFKMLPLWLCCYIRVEENTDTCFDCGVLHEKSEWFWQKDKRRTIQIADAHTENFFSDKPGIWHLISLYWKPGRQNSAIADCNKINWASYMQAVIKQKQT